jgi:hypothetical protein
MVFGFDQQIQALTGGLGDPFASAIDGSSIEVQQIEGDRPITLLIRARAMPYPGGSWEGEQHSKLTFYPGNPVATQQVLGSRESPTTFEGTWKQRFMRGAIVKNGDASAITTPLEAVELIEAMRRSGRQVRVQWATFVRTGLIKRFAATPDRPQDIPWELEFEWNSRDDEKAPRAATEQSAPAGNNLLKKLNQLLDTLAQFPAMAAAFQAQLVSTIRDIGDGVARVVDLLRAVETLVNLPSSVLGALKAAVGALGRQLQDFEHRIIGPRSSATDRQTATRAKGGYQDPARVGRRSSALTSSSVTQELQFEVWRRTLAGNARTLQNQLTRTLIDVLTRSQPKTVRVVTVRQNQTLYALSTQFYGSPDFANFLARSNRLTTALVPAGFQLRVPERPFAGTAGIEPLTDKQPEVGSGKCC